MNPKFSPLEEADIFAADSLQSVFNFSHAHTKEEMTEVVSKCLQLHLEYKSQDFSDQLAKDLKAYGIDCYRSDVEALSEFFSDRDVEDFRETLKKSGSPEKFAQDCVDGLYYHKNFAGNILGIFKPQDLIKAWRRLGFIGDGHYLS